MAPAALRALPPRQQRRNPRPLRVRQQKFRFPRHCLLLTAPDKPSRIEHVKDASNYLRGTIAESLQNRVTGALNPDDTHLIKFHGSYQQTNRDLESERKRQKLEPLYSFMIRVRVPGGVASSDQWQRMDALSDEYATARSSSPPARPSSSMAPSGHRRWHGQLLGFNVAIGGIGMGSVPAAQVVDVCEKVLTIQRDWGNRENRKFSRLKYTIDKFSLDAFVQELHQRLGYELTLARPYRFETSGDAFGWNGGPDGQAHVTLFIEGGRVYDKPGYELKTALREIAGFHTGEFRLTGNQNLTIANIEPRHRSHIQAILAAYGVWNKTERQTTLRLNSLACLALNTCSLAFAEAERYLPQLLDRLDAVIRANDLPDAGITIRMTGCPNGCARPYLGEIKLVGRAIGRYNLYLGANHAGQRLNKLYREMLHEDEIVQALTPLLEAYARQRQPAERFGDFVVRQGYVAAATHGQNFHA